MGKKFGRNGNGEGTIYNTIQKSKKAFDNSKMCLICSECSDRSFCENRTNWNKCEKCKNCTICLKKGVCDRFYCYNRFTAQITLNDGTRTTVSNAQSRTKSIEEKKNAEAKLQTNSYIKKNGITIIEVCEKISKQKLKSGKINSNTYDKDTYHYRYIKNWTAFNKPVQKITYNDINEFLNSIRHLSQGEIEKIKIKLNSAFMQCVLDKIIAYPDNPMLRITVPISFQTRKRVEAFEIDEQKKLMKYILSNNLVKSSKCNYDNTTLKNLFICSLLSAARIGELGALTINENIDLINNGFIIKTTLTQENGKIVKGSTTKTGRKKIERGQIDERFIPFDIFDKNLMLSCVKEQIQNSKRILNNKENLLFCKLDGSYIDHRSITTIFKRVCRESGIKLNLKTGCHIHMCRHTATTRMIEAGMDLMVIANILGHTDDRQIKETYGHILNNYRNKQLRNSRNYYKKIKLII